MLEILHGYSARLWRVQLKRTMSPLFSLESVFSQPNLLAPSVTKGIVEMIRVSASLHTGYRLRSMGVPESGLIQQFLINTAMGTDSGE